MKVLVTGANGMLRQDLCPILEDEGYDVVETDIYNMDFTNLSEVKNVIEKNMPDIVIHLGAYTNVDNAEDEPEKAYKINVEGTKNVSEICKKNNITLLYISTDYVFDGTKHTKYSTVDMPNPINIYGKTKFEGEEAVKKCEKYYIIRTSWLYGHHGKNFVETMISLVSQNKEIKVVDDQMGCPTWTVELANGIVKILAEEMPFGIYHVCGSGETSWYGFAKEIFRLCDLNANIKPCTTNEFQRKAKRPKYSVMENNKICRNWESALKDYIDLRCE